MSDEEEFLLPAADEEDLALVHAYDFLKHLTTLTLVALGGVLGLVQGNALGIKPTAFMLIMAFIGAGGALALITNASMIASRLLKRPRHRSMGLSVAVLQAIATCLFLLGVGVFVGAFSRVLQ